MPGLFTQPSMVHVEPSVTSALDRARDVVPLNTTALPERPLVVQVPFTSVALFALGELSTSVVPAVLSMP